MANDNTIVELVTRIEAAPPPDVNVENWDPGDDGGDSKWRTVVFGSDEEARVDLTDPDSRRRLELLTTLQAVQRPAYVEFSPDRVITEVLKPVVGRVLSVTPDDPGYLHVRIDVSAARHIVSDAAPKDLIDLLKAAATTTHEYLSMTARADSYEIFDARQATPGMVPTTESIKDAAFDADALKMLTPVSLADAKQQFHDMFAERCTLPSPKATCIPFMFPDNGCEARAHRMCKLLNSDVVTAAKVWIFAKPGRKLVARTPNRNDCQQQWDFHVAPLILVGAAGNVRQYVIDPSVCKAVVPLQEWKNALRDKGASSNADTVISEMRVYAMPSNDQTNVRAEGFQETMNDLKTYRRLLVDRSDHKAQPPPYAHCPAD